MKPSMTRPLGSAVALTLFVAPLAATAELPEHRRGPGTERDDDCLVCHAGIGEEDAPKLDADLYTATSHGKEGCIGCHADVENPAIKHEEEDEDLLPVDCDVCHEPAGDAYRHSVHARPDRDLSDDTAPPSCAGCHGNHDIRPANDERSAVHPLRQSATCGQCHGADREAAGHPMPADDDTKNDKRVREGHDPRITAACSSCHDSHAVVTSTEANALIHPTQVSTTCGACHEEEAEDFAGSAHDQAAHRDGFDWMTVLAPDGDNHQEQPDAPPVCVTCHRMHGGSVPKSQRFRADLVEECGTCHAELMKTYVESYHGKATLLGSDSVAKCSDCHGFHSILGPDAPESRVSPANKLQTCQECHEGAPPGFAGFWAHADHGDHERYPVLYWVYTFMTLLLVSVFSFFGLHTLLWGIREGLDAIRLRGQPRHVSKGPRISRFSTTDRVLHFFVVISFLGLAATGAPLKFAEASWAVYVLGAMGGVEAAGWLHRIFAVVTFGYFFAHIIQLGYNLVPEFRKGNLRRTLFGPDSLVPRLSDLVDVVRHFSWFLGLGKKPTWDRWTYWEKFDYWAVFWGVAIIGSSGLVLWFPMFFTQLLPGWVVNIALVVHSDEALLAIGFIFGVHFFNSHLRRAKFPMDEVIFTGSVPEAEFREERGREWERMEKEERIEERFVPDPHPIFRAWMRVFGMSAWLIGLVILGLIIHGFVTTH